MTMSRQAFDDAELRSAFVDGRFLLHYQPQYASRDSSLVGAEALVRLKGPDGKLVPPAAFIAQVERSALVHDLGLDLFRQGCLQAAGWPTLTVAINVSPVQFQDAGLTDKLSAIAADVGVDPRRIEIEITEGLFFDDPDGAEAALSALHRAGFGIALDDFGTGYSSLGYLLRFPVSKIKIDRSFITSLPTDIKSASIVHALIAMARALGLKVVAEGIETEAQRVFLRTAGCHILQGYLLGAPMPPDQILRRSEDGRPTA